MIIKDSQNNTYESIWNEIKKYDKITICSHIDPDGDTIASSLALKELIKLNLNKAVKISGEAYPRYLEFLEKPEDVSDAFWNDSLKIAIDTSTTSRIHDQRIKTEEAIKIDHHDHQEKWLLEIGGDHWPACGEVLYELIQDQQLKTNQDIKDAIFIAIWTDTSGMTQRNISNQTYEAINWSNQNQEEILKKMELSEEEKKIFNSIIIKEEKIVSYSISDEEITNDIYREYLNQVFYKTKTEVLIVCIKYKGYYRIGMRSKGKIDVSKYASARDGGGHFASAGFKIVNKSFPEAKEILNKLIKEINNDNKSRTN